MIEDKAKNLAERGFVKAKFPAGMKPKKDLSSQKFGKLSVQYPIGWIANEIAWLCVCECGNKDIKTYNELQKSPNVNCGCIDNAGEAYEFWQKNKKRLGGFWRKNFIKFRDECYTKREGKKYLNRLYTDKKLGIHNFFWSDNTEEQHRIHDKVKIGRAHV